MAHPTETLPLPDAVLSNGVPVVVAPRPVPSVVSWHGSIETYPRFDEGGELVQDIVASLLNKGTRRRDRFELAADLEDRGAEVHFSSHGTRVHFSGKALARDVADVLQMTAEQLAEPSLDETEFEKAVQRMRASLRRSSSNTSYRSGAALRERLFSPAHPNYNRDPAEDLKHLAELSIGDARAFHEAHFGGASVAVCASGDIESEAFARMAGECFGRWDGGSAKGSFDPTGRLDDERSRSEIHIPDRDNLDVRFGHAVHLRRNDPDFLALYVANYILGGNFSARLMAKVRNELGLTYGIGSSLSGFDVAYEGMWQISVTLSKDRLEEGIEATMGEIVRFLDTGATQEELDAKKTTICGSYEVGLSTTRGLAQTLHANLRNGFEASYLSEFPDIIRALTLEEVNRSISKYLDADRLRIAIAGSLPRKAEGSL